MAECPVHPISHCLRLPSALQVLAVVALMLVYVAAVDTLCGQIPRGIQYAHTHPGWLRRAASSLLTAAQQRLVGGG